MIDDATSKFKQVLEKTPKNSQAQWCLGNAYTSHGFLLTDEAEANRLFKEAAKCFKQAAQLEPNNDMYKKALMMSDKAPEVYKDLQRQLQEHASSGGASGHPGQGSGKAKGGEFWWDVAGWVTLVGLMVSMSILSKYFPPPAPPTGPPMGPPPSGK